MTLYDDPAAIDFMLAEVGEDVTINGVPGKGAFDEADEELFASGLATQTGLTVALTVKTSQFSVMAPGTAVVRTGPPLVNYLIHERLQLGDGALTKLLLARA